MTKKKPHPADLAMLAGIASAVSYSVHLFKDGETVRIEGIPTLLEARARAVEMAAGASRAPGVYAIDADGFPHLVPASYDPAANPAKPTQEAAADAKTEARKPKKPVKAAKPIKAAKPSRRTLKRASASHPGAKEGESKTDTAIRLLSRPNGATRKEVTEACDWPSINLTPIAQRHGFKLTSSKDGVLRFVPKGGKAAAA